MKPLDVLMIRYTPETHKLQIQKTLSKLSWLEKFADNPEGITLEVLESLYKSVEKKYGTRMGYTTNSGQGSRVCMLTNSKGEWVTSVFFVSFWECMAKVIVVLYAHHIKGVPFNVGGGPK